QERRSGRKFRAPFMLSRDDSGRLPPRLLPESDMVGEYRTTTWVPRIVNRLAHSGMPVRKQYSHGNRNDQEPSRPWIRLHHPRGWRKRPLLPSLGRHRWWLRDDAGRPEGLLRQGARSARL